jgi:hypothetical protein
MGNAAAPRFVDELRARSNPDRGGRSVSGHPCADPRVPHASPGAEPHDARTGPVEGCPGLPRGRAPPGRRDVT